MGNQPKNEYLHDDSAPLRTFFDFPESHATQSRASHFEVTPPYLANVSMKRAVCPHMTSSQFRLIAESPLLEYLPQWQICSIINSAELRGIVPQGDGD